MTLFRDFLKNHIHLCIFFEILLSRIFSVISVPNRRSPMIFHYKHLQKGGKILTFGIFIKPKNENMNLHKQWWQFVWVSTYFSQILVKKIIAKNRPKKYWCTWNFLEGQSGPQNKTVLLEFVKNHNQAFFVKCFMIHSDHFNLWSKINFFCLHFWKNFDFENFDFEFKYLNKPY